MAANPYMGDPFGNGVANAFRGYQEQKARNAARALQQQQLAAMYGYRQQQLSDRESNAKSLDTARKEAEFDRRERNGDFDGKPEAYVASVRQSMGLDNGSGSGNLGMTPTPTDMGSGNLGTTPQPTDMGSGDLGTPGPSPVPRVSAMPLSIPGVGQGMPAVPPGPGLMQPPAAPPSPGAPNMNALGALGARGIGPGAYSPPSPPPGFQMPNPLANGPVTRPQPFGAVPDAPPGMPPPGAMPPPNAMSPMGGPPQTFKPWGAPVSPYVPVGRVGGINPLDIATRQVQSAQAILDQSQQGIHYSPKALQQARETVDKGLDNLRQYQAQGLTGANDANKYISDASDKGADPFTLLSQLNNDRAGGANVEVPLRNVDRGLPESEWTKIENAALAAHSQDPEHWRDAQYQGKPLSYYLDANGNRLQVPDIKLSAAGQTNMAAKQAQARSADARTAYLGDQDTFLTKYRTALTDAQVGMLEANKKAVLEGRLPVEQAQAEYDAIRNQYAPQTFQSTIDKNNAGTANLGVTADIGRQRLGGTYNPAGNTPGYLNPMQKQQFAGQQARLNKIETSLTQYENIKKSVAANTTYDAATRQRLMAAQDANIIPLQSEKARVQANLQQMSAPSSAVSQSGGAGSIPVQPSPMGDKIDATAKSMQASGAANQPHYCERVARTTYQQNTNAYNKYWDSTAKSTLNNFKSAGIAKPYTPGAPIPAGSLLYSQNGQYGHVQVVGNDGARYDQYGKNQKFPPSFFQYYVPPPGASGSQTATRSTGRSVSPNAKAAARALLGM